MNTQKLFMMQKGLDSHIESQHALENEDLFDRKILALLVELGELANETRCFKFWSLKPSSAEDVILEEFVDGIHFILSLGLECGYEDVREISAAPAGKEDASEQFLEVYGSIQRFRMSREKADYIALFQSYMRLALLLGLGEDQIEQAYVDKNEVNYQRQREGY